MHAWVTHSSIRYSDQPAARNKLLVAKGRMTGAWCTGHHSVLLAIICTAGRMTIPELLVQETGVSDPPDHACFFLSFSWNVCGEVSIKPIASSSLSLSITDDSRPTISWRGVTCPSVSSTVHSAFCLYRRRRTVTHAISRFSTSSIV